VSKHTSHPFWSLDPPSETFPLFSHSPFFWLHTRPFFDTLFTRSKRNSSTLAFFKAGQSSVLFSARHPMEVFLAEWTSNEENQETLAVISKCQNAGILDLASAFLRLVNCVSPASAFCHQGQSGTAGHVLVRHCPALHLKGQCHEIFDFRCFS
jgi:hypothetical protein